MRLMLLIRSLHEGGAERQLVTLACALKLRDIPVSVMTLYDGPMRAELEQNGVNIIDLRKRGRWDVLFLGRMIREIRLWYPSAIYCFGGTILFTVLVRAFVKNTKLIWGIRASNMDFGFYDGLSRILLRFYPIFAHFSDLIICNSEMGKKHVLNMGFPKGRTVVVSNGINTDKWVFDNKSRTMLRKTWGIPQKIPLIGIVARIDPIKDHKTFIRMAALCYKSRPDLKFVVIGNNIDAAYTKELKEFAKDLLGDSTLIWAGNHTNMSAVYSALDVLVLTSLSEGFPNVIGEGMACEVNVVSTNAGDAKRIIDDTGIITDIGDAEGLMHGVLTILADEAQKRNAYARDRIIKYYSVDLMLNLTLNLIKQVLSAQENKLNQDY